MGGSGCNVGRLRLCGRAVSLEQNASVVRVSWAGETSVVCEETAFAAVSSTWRVLLLVQDGSYGYDECPDWNYYEVELHVFYEWACPEVGIHA